MGNLENGSIETETPGMDQGMDSVDWVDGIRLTPKFLLNTGSEGGCAP